MNNFNKKNLCENLVFLRNSAGKTQKEVAHDLGFAASTIGMWEQGQREPDLDTIKKLADYYGTSVSKILGLSQANLTALPAKLLNMLSNYRRNKELTIYDVASNINVDPQKLANWELGTAVPDLETLEKWIFCLEITTTDLLNSLSSGYDVTTELLMRKAFSGLKDNEAQELARKILDLLPKSDK